MAAPSLTYTLTNGTAADASQVMQDFNDLLNGITDGSKDLSISALTVAGTATFNGNVALGNATGDTITYTGRVASAINPSAAATYALGTSALPWSAINLDNGATDGGAVYFNSTTTSFLKSDAAGLVATFGGFTSAVLPAAITGVTSLPTAAFVAPTVQKFTSGTAATYTLPTSPRSPLYIVVELVGGGGGGAGSGTASSSSDAGNGTASTWSGLTLSAGGGSGGTWGGNSGLGGSGGTASLGTGVGIAIGGMPGGSGVKVTTVSTVELGGGWGGNGYFGGGGKAGTQGGGGNAAATNSGGGGGGAGHPNSVNAYCGSGGGSGAYVRAIIGSPASTYTYTVGAAGVAGSAGTSGYAGAAGAAGIILVTEMYQ